MHSNNTTRLGQKQQHQQHNSLTIKWEEPDMANVVIIDNQSLDRIIKDYPLRL